MVINFINSDKEILKSIKFNERQCDDIIFQLNFPKEIVFAKIIKDQNDIDYSFLNQVYQQVKAIDQNEIECIELITTDKQKFTFESKVQDIFYKTFLYSYQGTLMFKIQLSFRLREDHPVIYNKDSNILICDKYCKYFDFEKHYCNFFHEPLNNLNEICTQCFLHERNNQIRELVDYNTHILGDFDERYTDKER